jgi:hypothetical protein
MRPDFVSQLAPGIVFIVRFSKRVPNPSGNYASKIRIISATISKYFHLVLNAKRIHSFSFDDL